MQKQDFELPACFYLGKNFDLENNALLDRPQLYDAPDLTTHAVIVGMTGSGKTGLGITMLEEAAIDDIPVIAIDPKGDLTNLLLTFPEMQPADFRAWINPEDAHRADLNEHDYAAQIAAQWREGIESWGQSQKRVELLRNSADFRIYTPGSDAGLPVSVLGNFAAPPFDWHTEAETAREQISAVVSALLSLVDIEADPLRSREHILMSNIFEYYWQRGEDLDVAKLIRAMQQPPIRKFGVFDVETFFPEKDRFDLAMALNNIIAAPSFALWTQGDTLDVGALLRSPAGRPRVSVFYIAHLSDHERMFFVTLLLEAVLSWMRLQSGTTNLRALLYFDEIYGYLPPYPKNPPTKTPVMTLLKQARAFGLGLALATQNPGDLDYKALTNAGTWFIGRLQTERDKNRLLEGLEGAATTAGTLLDRHKLDDIISALPPRTFLLHNIHRAGKPQVFQTRWTLSYLRGPLTRPQIRRLMTAKSAEEAAQSAELVDAQAYQSPAAANRAMTTEQDLKRGLKRASRPIPRAPLEGFSQHAPVLPSTIQQVFIRVDVSGERVVHLLESDLGERVTARERHLIYELAVCGAATVTFNNQKMKVRHVQQYNLLAPPPEHGQARWDRAESLGHDLCAVEYTPFISDAWYGEVSAALTDTRRLRELEDDFVEYIYRHSSLRVLYNPLLKVYSQVGEQSRYFVQRCQEVAQKKRDAEARKIRAKYQRELKRWEQKLRREQRELEMDQREYEARKREETMNLLETGANFLFGKRRHIRSVGIVGTKHRQVEQAWADVIESEQAIADYEHEITEIQKRIEAEMAELNEKWAETLKVVEEARVTPRRGDIDVNLLALAWVPSWLLKYQRGGHAVETAIMPARR